MRSDKDKLLDILEEIEKIEKYSLIGKELFEHDELIQSLIVQRLQNIGEATAKLSEDLKGKYPNIPWIKVIAMPNIIVHEYFKIDLNEIWNTVITKLPDFKSRIQEILLELKS
jgi:uncharacterized protein with HEPN domain